jgi:DNA polymerase-1
VIAFGFDLETKGLNPWGAGTRVLCGAYAAGHLTTSWGGTMMPAAVRHALRSPDCTMVGHNLAFDLAWLPDEPRCRIFDTMVAQYRLDENAPASLESVAQAWLGRGKKPQPPFEELTPELLEYNEEDARLVYDLYAPMRVQLAAEGQEAIFERDMDLIKLLVRMRKRGILLDWSKLARAQAQVEAEALATLEELNALVGKPINPRSGKQIAALLYDDYKLPILARTEKGAPATDREAIALLKAWANAEQAEVLAAISRHRRLDKLDTGFLSPLPEHRCRDGRLRTTLHLGRGGKARDHQGGTATGRLSSSEPNLQNLPKRADKIIRGCVVPSPGHRFLRADYSQVELRLAAWLSADPVMRGIFARGEDFHTATLAKLERVSYETAQRAVKESQTWKDKRDATKRVNFGAIYGAYPNTIWKTAIGDGFDVSKTQIESIWHEQRRIFAYFWAWAEAVSALAVQNGRVSSPFNVVRRFPGLTSESDYGRVSSAQRQAVNHLIQNSAAEIMLYALLDVEAAIAPWGGRLLLTIHDEILVEYPAATVEPAFLEALVKEAMQDRAMARMREKGLPDLDHLNLIVETSAQHESWAV